jgi:sulfide dehydrogenase [flavocytochrome c] flavoprotein subunit
MTGTTRRNFLKASAAAAAASALGFPALLRADTPKARVVVIGGGYGGTIAAKYIQMANPNVQVTLIEKESAYVSCPLSNEVLSGERDLKTLTFKYQGLSKRGITVVQDEIVAIAPDKREVLGKSKTSYPYDKLVVSPGVSFRWDAIKGMSEAAAQTIPHAWKAGPQTLLLKKQLSAMRNGGTCIIVAPPNPFRCPPGPYERAAQIAFYLKRHKPKSKVLVLDAKDAFSKQGLFVEGWKRNYGDMIEWVGAAAGGAVEAIDVKKRVLTGTVEEYKGDVINLIPAQKAATLAEVAGLVDASGWCPVDQKTFESTLHKDIYVIGDSVIAGAMPKSGYAANSQAKVAAAAIVAALNGQPAPEPSYVNTCYSIIAPDYGISVAGVYQLKDGKIVDVPGAGGLSPANAPARTRAIEVQFALGWYRNITADMFT